MSKYADLFNVACETFSIIPHAVVVKASLFLRRDVSGWRQSKSAGETLCEKVVRRQFRRANPRLLAGNDPILDPTSADNDMEMQREAEQKMLHQMAKVNNLLEMWHSSQNLQPTQKESHTQNNQLTAVGYILDTKEIVHTSWSLFQHDGLAAFIVLDTSPVPSALSGKDLPEWSIWVLNIRQIKWINCHSAKSYGKSSPESISDTENLLNGKGDLDNLNDSEDNWEADNESDRELVNGSEESKPLG